MLPAIVSEEMLSATATLESEERAFAVRQGRDSNRYLHALYLKAMAALNHAHFQPKDLPRQFRNRILEQLQLDANLARILTIDRRDKSVIVSAVRAFLGVSAGSAQDREEILLWLRDGVAQKEHDIAVLISAISERFREMKVELPSWSAVTGIAECAVQGKSRPPFCRPLSAISTLTTAHVWMLFSLAGMAGPPLMR